MTVPANSARAPEGPGLNSVLGELAADADQAAPAPPAPRPQLVVEPSSWDLLCEETSLDELIELNLHLLVLIKAPRGSETKQFGIYVMYCGTIACALVYHNVRLPNMLDSDLARVFGELASSDAMSKVGLQSLFSEAQRKCRSRGRK